MSAVPARRKPQGAPPPRDPGAKRGSRGIRGEHERRDARLGERQEVARDGQRSARACRGSGLRLRRGQNPGRCWPRFALRGASVLGAPAVAQASGRVPPKTLGRRQERQPRPRTSGRTDDVKGRAGPGPDSETVVDTGLPARPISVFHIACASLRARHDPERGRPPRRGARKGASNEPRDNERQRHRDQDRHDLARLHRRGQRQEERGRHEECRPARRARRAKGRRARSARAVVEHGLPERCAGVHPPARPPHVSANRARPARRRRRAVRLPRTAGAEPGDGQELARRLEERMPTVASVRAVEKSRTLATSPA